MVQRMTISVFVAVLLIGNAAIADDASDLAKKLANPVANLISVPLALNTIQGSEAVRGRSPMSASNLSSRSGSIRHGA